MTVTRMVVPPAVMISTRPAPSCFAARIALATSACVKLAERRLIVTSTLFARPAKLSDRITEFDRYGRAEFFRQPFGKFL